MSSRVEIELNPYQGLKPPDSKVFGDLRRRNRIESLSGIETPSESLAQPEYLVEIELNPYQGLKLKSAIT